MSDEPRVLVGSGAGATTGVQAPTPPLEEALAAFYGPLAASASAARRVGWESAGAHRLRLSAIVAAIEGPLLEAGAGASVRDVGSGEGALVGVLRSRGFRGRYLGEDVLPAMVARAAEAYPNEAFAVVSDGFAPAPEGTSTTAVVCSGALNTRVTGDHDAWVERALTGLWARADAVVAVDLAVADRHPPGVGLALTDLARAWSVARKLAPVVVVREDVVPGEALLVLARSRADAWRGWMPEAAERAEVLLGAGEAAAALALAASAGMGDAAGVAGSVRGRALAALGRLDEAERALAALVTPSEVDTVARAQVAWRSGRKAACEALLRELATRSDEGRAHLVALLLGRGAGREAREVCARIDDPWIRRELEAALPKA